MDDVDQLNGKGVGDRVNSVTTAVVAGQTV